MFQPQEQCKKSQDGNMEPPNDILILNSFPEKILQALPSDDAVGARQSLRHPFGPRERTFLGVDQKKMTSSLLASSREGGRT